MAEQMGSRRRMYLFLLNRADPEGARLARRYLKELGVRVTSQLQAAALVGLASTDQAEAAAQTGLFAAVSSGRVTLDRKKAGDKALLDAISSWNARHEASFLKLKQDRTERGKPWNDKEKDSEPPFTLRDPRDFKAAVLKKLQTDEETLLKSTRDKHRNERPSRLEGEAFAAYQAKLDKHLNHPTLAYELARIACHLEPEWAWVILELDKDFLEAFFREAACWKLENEISVGVVFVASSRPDGPKFSASARSTLEAEITDGLDWLATEAPLAADLTWMIDWQAVAIDVANGSNSSQEDYWRDPAMAALHYDGHTYPAAWSSVADYREDMRRNNHSAHALVIFVTPYANSWHGYAGGGRVTLANRNNWGGWGIGTIDRITAHEVLHLFGSADEYTGSGTPCSSCATLHGCYQIPNGNCGCCARPFQDCVMGGNQQRICPWTRAHVGWADLLVELTTSGELWSGTDDDVWLDIGDRTFLLDTPNHNDRETGNIDGLALCGTGLERADIKRIGIRKSSDGFNGGWKLQRVRVWLRGELVCDANAIGQWLENETRWWASASCGSSSDIVNHLQVQVSTADVTWAGTDDDVTLYMGGKSWKLDNEGHDDFERGHTDTFDLDPGTGLYRSALGAIRIHKAPDGAAGGWKLKGLKILVNGIQIYSNQGINRWLEDDDRDWYGSI